METARSSNVYRQYGDFIVATRRFYRAADIDLYIEFYGKLITFSFGMQ